jgi:hypothetical protein
MAALTGTPATNGAELHTDEQRPTCRGLQRPFSFNVVLPSQPGQGFFLGPGPLCWLASARSWPNFPTCSPGTARSRGCPGTRPWCWADDPDRRAHFRPRETACVDPDAGRNGSASTPPSPRKPNLASRASTVPLSLTYTTLETDGRINRNGLKVEASPPKLCCRVIGDPF